MTAHKQIQVPNAPSSALYSQAIAAGGFLFIAGQIPMDAATGKLVEGGIIEQTKKAFENFEAVIKGAGLDFKALVRVEIYLKDIRDLKMVNTLYLELLTHTPKPARQAMQVGNLPFDSLIEISGIAVMK
jgi:2-iminobutanoate/2-iminopropanoate deaminase